MSKIRVVLADDHLVVRAGIRMLLEQDPNIEVVGEADNGEQAIELVSLHSPDVLLLDMEMPGKNGVVVAQELTRMKAKVRILGLSAHDDAQYVSSLLQNGAVGYLTKGEAPDKMVSAVHGVARGETGWFSQQVIMQMANQVQKGKEYKEDPKNQDNFYNLTRREKEILGPLRRGLTSKQIATELVITERTVRFHLSNLYDKLGVSSRTQAIAWALKHDFV